MRAQCLQTAHLRAGAVEFLVLQVGGGEQVCPGAVAAPSQQPEPALLTSTEIF